MKVTIKGHTLDQAAQDDRGELERKNTERDERPAISRSELLLNRSLPDAIPPVSEPCSYHSRAKGVSSSKILFLKYIAMFYVFYGATAS